MYIRFFEYSGSVTCLCKNSKFHTIAQKITNSNRFLVCSELYIMILSIYSNSG